MAKKRFTPINYSTSEKAHFLRIEKRLKLVEQIYNEAIKELSDVAFRAGIDPNKPFSFNDYPNARKKAMEVFNEMAQNVEVVILKGENQEWLAAANRNDQLIDSIFSGSRVQRKLLEQYQERNLEALKAFQKRKDNGLGLSSRVWRNTSQFKSEIEMGIDLGLGEGKSASALSRDLRSYLHNPDNLFRRVRDKHGALHLSKRAEAYNPGQGVYRSSYKNAMRLARTEINSAYRESDYHRWQQLDFVVGIEIRLSNNPNHCPTCAELAGKYPKDFKFVGWHPHCRCSAIPILKTDDEFMQDVDKILNDDPASEDSENSITSMPHNFTNWIENNKDRIAAAKSVPFFIKDNYKGGNINKGLRFNVDEPIKLEPKLGEIIKKLNNYKVGYNKVELLKNQLAELEIIERVGGGDLTKGSCSSLAFAYAGNKFGFDVLDFRDGVSREMFSRVSTITEIANKVGGITVKGVNDFTKASDLLKHVKEGTEYYFTSGAHAAIVRKTQAGFEYLELQSATKNGFRPLNNAVLKNRFGAKKSRSSYGVKYQTSDVIIDLGLLKNEPLFREMLGYINTVTGEQKKGIRGRVR